MDNGLTNGQLQVKADEEAKKKADAKSAADTATFWADYKAMGYDNALFNTPGIDESELLKQDSFRRAGFHLYNMFGEKPPLPATYEELTEAQKEKMADYAISTTAWFNNNIVSTGKTAYTVLNNATAEQKIAFLYALDCFGHTNTSAYGIGRFAVQGVLADPTTWVSVVAGIFSGGTATAGITAAKEAGKQGLLLALKETAKLAIKEGAKKLTTKVIVEEGVEQVVKTTLKDKIVTVATSNIVKTGLKTGAMNMGQNIAEQMVKSDQFTYNFNGEDREFKRQDWSNTQLLTSFSTGFAFGSTLHGVSHFNSSPFLRNWRADKMANISDAYFSRSWTPKFGMDYIPKYDGFSTSTTASPSRLSNLFNRSGSTDIETAVNRWGSNNFAPGTPWHQRWGGKIAQDWKSVRGEFFYGDLPESLRGSYKIMNEGIDNAFSDKSIKLGGLWQKGGEKNLHFLPRMQELAKELQKSLKNVTPENRSDILKKWSKELLEVTENADGTKTYSKCLGDMNDATKALHGELAKIDAKKLGKYDKFTSRNARIETMNEYKAHVQKQLIELEDISKKWNKDLESLKSETPTGKEFSDFSADVKKVEQITKGLVENQYDGVINRNNVSGGIFKLTTGLPTSVDGWRNAFNPVARMSRTGGLIIGTGIAMEEGYEFVTGRDSSLDIAARTTNFALSPIGATYGFTAGTINYFREADGYKGKSWARSAFGDAIKSGPAGIYDTNLIMGYNVWGDQGSYNRYAVPVMNKFMSAEDQIKTPSLIRDPKVVTPARNFKDVSLNKPNPVTTTGNSQKIVTTTAGNTNPQTQISPSQPTTTTNAGNQNPNASKIEIDYAEVKKLQEECRKHFQARSGNTESKSNQIVTPDTKSAETAAIYANLNKINQQLRAGGGPVPGL